MASRPLLLLAVLLTGLLGLKALSLADGAAGFFAERAFAAAAPEPASGHDEGESQADDHAEDAEPTDEAHEDETPPPPPPDTRRTTRIPTASQLGLETDLAQRRRELEQRAEALDTREQLLTVAEARYNERLQDLQALRDEIQGLIDELEVRRDDEISNIVNAYEQLEPDAAAGILQAMQETDPDTLLLVAGKLQTSNPRRFAAVLSEMQPAFAAMLTSQLRARAVPADAELEARDAVAGEG